MTQDKTSKDFPDMSGNRNFSPTVYFFYEYWLVPGLETVHGNKNVTAMTTTSIPVTGTTTGETMQTYVKGVPGLTTTGGANCPRSMAVAYSEITIDGCSIHLTELGISGNTLYTVKGWTDNVAVKVYRFCTIDPSGVPTPILAGATGVWHVALSQNPPAFSGAAVDAGLPTTEPSGVCVTWYAHHDLGDNPFNVGNQVQVNDQTIAPLYLAVTVGISAPFPNPSPTYAIHSRTISVTLHGRAPGPLAISDASMNLTNPP